MPNGYGSMVSVNSRRMASADAGDEGAGAVSARSAASRGTGLNAGENMELRMRGGFPRANAVKHVKDKHGVNMLANICAIDRATLSAAMDYWVPGVKVTGVHELVANALIMKGEKERETNLRAEPLPGKEGK